MGSGAFDWVRKFYFPLITLGLSLLVQATMAVAGDREDCLSEHTGAKIHGCTAMLEHFKDDPDQARMFIGLRAQGYLLKGEYDLAIRDFTEAIRLGDTNVYHARAIAYEKIGRRSEAIDDFRAAMFSQNASTQEMAAAEAGLNRLNADPTPIKSPETILDDFYVGSGSPYISKRLLAFLWKDETENLMILDFDPRVDGQDALITESKISLTPAPNDGQMEWRVTNTFKNFDQPSKVRYQIAREDNIWKVFNIYIRDWNLLDMYEDAFVNLQ